MKVIDGKFNTSLNISFFDPSEYKISVVINNLDQKICEDTYFEIIRRDLTINITPNSPKVMNIVDIKVDLIDEDGGKIKEDGGFVIYKINGKTIKDENGNTLKTEVINSSSRYKYQLPNNIGCGVYDIVVTYIGDRCYNTTKSTEQFTLKRLTIEDIKLTDITTKAYDMTNINIVVNDIKAKQLVGNTKVVIKLNNKTFTDYTMQNGVLNVTLNTAKLQLKNYTLTFKFAKNSFYDYKEQNINLCIVERNIKMNIDVNNPKTTQNLSLNVTIDDAGRTLNEGFVIFKINGKTITVDVKNNTAQLNYILTSAYNAGSVNISAHYRAKNYIQENQTVKTSIIKSDLDDVSIQIDTPKGENTTLNITLCDEVGKQITTNSKIAIKINGKTQNTTTIVDGKIRLNLNTCNMKSGNHTISLIVGENRLYNMKRFEIPLTIK